MVIIHSWQSKGVTKQLLDALYDDPTLIRCTLASSDRRAVSRYMRVGMTPRWPMYILDLVDATKLGTPRYRAEVCTDVSEWLHYDYRLVGHDRSVDIVHYFVAHCDAALLQIKDGTRLVGQALVQRRHYDPGAVGARNVGPVGVFERADAAHAVHAAVAWVVAMPSAFIRRGATSRDWWTLWQLAHPTPLCAWMLPAHSMAWSCRWQARQAWVTSGPVVKSFCSSLNLL